jgi:hypothetical protein
VALMQFDHTLPFATRELSSTMSRSHDAQDLETKATKK